MRIIGLTGGIGSGKAAVTRILADLGAATIDADRIGHRVYDPGTVGWTRVVDEFGDDVVAPDGTIDRGKLGAKVFADPAALARLNALVHPLIGEAVRDAVAEVGSRDPAPAAVVIEAAVLVEAGWNRLSEEVWVVTAPRERRIERVVRSRGVDRAEVERRIANQVDDVARARVATLLLDNSGTLDDLRARVEDAWKERVVDRGASGATA